MVVFTVPGKPQGKARARTLKSGHSYTPKKTREYEELVKSCYIGTQPHQCFESEPLAVNIYARYEIPKRTSKHERERMMQGYILPTKKPDADNIAKVICDALNGVAYNDDAQVVRLTVVKEYARADNQPHVTVSIEELLRSE